VKKPLEVIIGLEIHIQLKTKSKMFCSCPNLSIKADPNTLVCPVCMGHPGTLPVINQEAINQGLRLALALHCRIANQTRFDRKNYFYPDLPKGYQISQLDLPLAVGGHINLIIDGHERRLNLERLHLEEDAGKNIHQDEKTKVDFNRVGTPLAEIVTNADLRSPSEAKFFLQELRLIARYIGASEADMEKGQLRCDANISLRPEGEIKLYPKTEVKNMNSFKAVEKALVYEVSRQTKLWQDGVTGIGDETRGWDENEQKTVAQRGKEGSDDYRYFPEPDLVPLKLSKKDLNEAAKSLPELPYDKRKRFVKIYSLKPEEASVIVGKSKAMSEFFEAVISELKNWLYDLYDGPLQSKDKFWLQNQPKAIKLAHSWITSELFKHLKSDKVAISKIKLSPEDMAELIAMIFHAKVNSSAAQTILEKMYLEGREPHHIAEEEDLYQTSNKDEIGLLIKEVIRDNPKQVAQFKGGKDAVLKFLVGQGMRLSKGKANPQVVEELFKKKFKK